MKRGIDAAQTLSMQHSYSTWLVVLSMAVAIVVSYTALNLSSRVSLHRGRVATAWLIGGAIAMGIGVWSMHFIGMLALHLPIPLTYSIPMTLASLAIAVFTAALALNLVRGSSVSIGRLSLGALLMGAGIALMHYTGVWSIRMQPAPTHDPALTIVSIAIAFFASFAALWLTHKLRRGNSRQTILARTAAAVVMGLGISGMHYTAMLAARFDANAQSLPGVRLDNPWFAIALSVFVLAVMALTLLTVIYDSYLLRQVRDRDDEIARAHERMRHVETHDSLTGLPNRVALQRATQTAIEEARRDQGQFAIMVVNVDRLKAINDSLGHHAGDHLLREIARRLHGVLRRGDVLARLAGDEFTILSKEVRSARDIELMASEVLDTMRQPFRIGPANTHVSVSIGISMYPLDGDSFDLLLRRAAAAMRYTKDTVRGGYRFYCAEMSSFSDDRLALETDLRRAMEANELVLYYQPKVDIPTGRVRSAEALIRWHHPVHGVISPSIFIPVAEESGLIVPLGEWALRQACRQLRAWLDAGMSPIRIAVNMSAKQFKHDNLVNVVKSALEEARLQPGYLELELTESAVMHNPEQSAATLQMLSTMGVHISIDDFGTGYSSLSHLRRFPLDKLKIDRSFIRELMGNADDVAIVRAIISMAHSLRLRVVAEGVEKSEQLDFLRQIGCDQYQGHYCSPAVPADDFARLLRNMRSGRTELTEADMLKTQSRLSAYRR
jgi:diguanylate cyclase (GGDEF)-like protein